MTEQELLNELNRYERLEIWTGLPLREKMLMILKQFFPKI